LLLEDGGKRPHLPYFISHAGPQKAGIAMQLQRELQRHGVSAFLDETSLRLGDAAPAEMEATLRSACVVVVILTPAFAASEFCMEELHWALHPAQNAVPPPIVMPVFYNSSNVFELLQQFGQQISKANADIAQTNIQRLEAEAEKDSVATADLERLLEKQKRKQQQLMQKSSNIRAATKYTGIRADSVGR
jgi:TIR domain